MNTNGVRTENQSGSSNEQAFAAKNPDFFHLCSGGLWPFPPSVDTSRATEHALEAFHTLVMANQAAAEGLYNLARRQQEMTFNIARTTLDACSPNLPGGGAREPDASWTRMMESYAEVCAGLEVTRSASDAAFKALKRAPAMLASGRTEGVSAS